MQHRRPACTSTAVVLAQDGRRSTHCHYQPMDSENIVSKGILYINSSHDDCRYVHEAESSALSFRRFIPDAESILHTRVYAA